jgi:hypothetical protein
MPVHKRKNSASVRWLTPAEARDLVDQKSRTVLGISAAAFVENWKAGKYHRPDPDDCPGIVELSMLASLPKETRGRKNTRNRGRAIR